ncbi:DinB family protein [Singulisphaera sp. PoT]|uniref:DinB family protein n=1 Tax=Singulisphaera sp. PoT TaxID=3411797 RepID=UPI003BF595EF
MPTAKDAIRASMGMGEYLLKLYFQDLTDEELAAVPVSGMNPAAWQIGHVIAVEHGAIEKVRPGFCPPLPEGFKEAHAKEVMQSGAFKPALSKEEYLDLWAKTRAGSYRALDDLTDEDMNAETGSKFVPTVLALMSLVGTHASLHAGQMVAVRRKLGKPVLL